MQSELRDFVKHNFNNQRRFCECAVLMGETFHIQSTSCSVSDIILLMLEFCEVCL
jgi:hypothetical protein